MKTILVPTDFSPAAQNALDYAIVLAKKINGSIFLMNAYSMPQSGSAVMIDVSDVLKNDSTAKLEEEKNRVASALENVEITTISHNGSPVWSIVNEIESKKIDFVIMGTTGATGLKETFLGSNTSSLIKEISAPIIAVPEKYKENSISEVTVSTDLVQLGKSNAFHPLKEVMDREGAHVSIINISDNLENTDPTAFVNEALDLDDLFFGVEHSFKFIENGDIEKGILNYINENKTDLLVVVSRKRNFFERLFHKSISKKLAMHSEVPIMVLSE